MMIDNIPSKPYLDAKDIKDRYNVGINKAYEIIRCVHRVCGSKLGPGKVLPSELAYWERRTISEEENGG